MKPTADAFEPSAFFSPESDEVSLHPVIRKETLNKAILYSGAAFAAALCSWMAGVFYLTQ